MPHVYNIMFRLAEAKTKYGVIHLKLELYYMDD